MMKKDEILLLSAVNNATATAVPEERIRLLLDSAYRASRKKPATLDLLVTTDGEMEKMNRRHLRHDGPTDVLAFEDGEEEDGRLRLGDIAVSLDTARRVAAERGVGWEQELAFYALHGLFHLLGMRDDDEAGRAAMHEEQARAMREFGWRPKAGLLDADGEQGEGGKQQA